MGRRFAIAIAAVSILTEPAVARGQGAAAAAPASRTAVFDIPAQPLSSAIIAFSRISGVQVLFDTGAAASQRSSAVAGAMTGGEALRQLLKGTEFAIHYVGPGSVTLVVPDRAAAKTAMRLDTLRVEAPPLVIGNSQRFAAYADGVMTDVRRALQNDGRVSRGRYALKVRLWIGPDGRVDRSEVLKSSGDKGLDAIIERRLNAVLVSTPPPADLPQPLVFEFWTRPISG